MKFLRRRWIQLWVLLGLIVVVFAGLTHEWTIAKRNREIQTWFESIGGAVSYNHGGLQHIEIANRYVFKPPWLNRITDLHLTSGSPQLDRDELKKLRQLTGLKVLKLEVLDLVDSDLEIISEIPNLHTLSIVKSSVTDQGLLNLEKAENLRLLELGERLKDSPSLEKLQKTRPDLMLR